uniref:Rho-GAP domain-containing protein n=1 Tax=Angiostrongylus cantonensis TaxID=6313 RepID=A0A0K0DPI2_ANGCA
ADHHEYGPGSISHWGIYRTCGVKSKIEEICEAFERCSRSSTVDISHVHPMNLACVVKLYLRKLPEPLMTHELYNEWIHFGMAYWCSTKSQENDVYEERIDFVCHIHAQGNEYLRMFQLCLFRSGNQCDERLSSRAEQKEMSGLGSFQEHRGCSEEKKEHPTLCPPFRLDGSSCPNICVGDLVVA